jgi:hypothetical protein
MELSHRSDGFRLVAALALALAMGACAKTEAPIAGYGAAVPGSQEEMGSSSNPLEGGTIQSGSHRSD